MQVADSEDEYDGVIGVVLIYDTTNDDHGYNIYVAFEEGRTNVFRADQLIVVEGAVQHEDQKTEISSRPFSSSGSASPTTSTSATPRTLNVGDRVQVVDRGHRYRGWVGIVQEITNDNVHVDLGGDFYRRVFRSNSRVFRPDQLKLIGGATTRASSHTERTKEPRYASFNDHRQQLRLLGRPQGNSYLQSTGYVPQSQYPFWQYLRSLSTGAKIGLAVAVGIVLLIIASIAISAEPWHSQKYKECEAAMEKEGYTGDDLKHAIQYCVDYP